MFWAASSAPSTASSPMAQGGGLVNLRIDGIQANAATADVCGRDLAEASDLAGLVQQGAAVPASASRLCMLPAPATRTNGREGHLTWSGAWCVKLVTWLLVLQL